MGVDTREEASRDCVTMQYRPAGAGIPAVHSFPAIAPAAWEHPEDAAALEALRSLPGFDRVVASTLDPLHRFLGEHRFANARPADPRVDGRLLASWREVRRALDGPELPVLVSDDPTFIGAALGLGDLRLVLGRAWMGRMPEEGVRVVLAHELAHVLSGHLRYKVLLRLLLTAGWGLRLVPATLPALGLVLLGLARWDRASELSADRASALVLGGAEPVVRTLELVAPTPAREPKSDLAAGVTALWRGAAELLAVHPSVDHRVAQVRSWAGDDAFGRALAGNYPRRDRW